MSTAILSETTSGESRERFGTLKALARNPLGMAGFVFLILVCLAVVFAEQFAPYDPISQDLSVTLSGPTAEHWLGTDQLGRDIFSRLLFGGKLTLIGIVEAVSVAFVIGVALGLIAGFVGGVMDTVISRATDIMMAIPAIVILLMVYALNQNNAHAGMFALGLLSVSGILRVTRTAAMSAKAETFIEATRVIGMGKARIIVKHVLPNIWGPVIVNTSILAALVLGIQGGLNYLNLGVTPPEPSWGGMVSEAQASIQLQPWLIIPSGLTIALTIVSFMLIADAMRDATSASTIRSGAGTKTKTTEFIPATDAADALEGEPLLSVDGLQVRFGELSVVQGVRLRVSPGETLGIVGESGCGKTVTASAILGSLGDAAKVDGDVEFHGQNLLRMGRRARAALRGKGIAYVSQDPMVALDPCYRVSSQLGEVVGRHDRIGGSKREARVLELLRMVGLSDPEAVAAKYPHELSGGMAQRVSIALALAGRPELLVADEITTALDVTIQAEILELLRTLRAETGMAMVMITHDLGVVADSCDRVAVMYAGQIVETADVATVFTKPAHPYTKALLAANPIVAKRGEALTSIPGSVPPPAEWPSSCHFAGRCEFATADCAAAAIGLRDAGEPGHLARCVRLAEIRRMP